MTLIFAYNKKGIIMKKSVFLFISLLINYFCYADSIFEPVRITNIFKSDSYNFKNSYVSNLLVKDEYFYLLIDSSENGNLSLYKIEKNAYSNSYLDDYIKWKLNINSNQMGFLKENTKMKYLESDIIRLAIKEKINDEKCNIKIYDINTNGQIIKQKLINVDFGVDLMFDFAGQDTLIGAYTVFNENNSYIKIEKFTIDDQIIIERSITFNSTNPSLHQLILNKKNEVGISVATENNKCYWNFESVLLDTNLNTIYSYTFKNVLHKNLLIVYGYFDLFGYLRTYGSGYGAARDNGFIIIDSLTSPMFINKGYYGQFYFNKFMFLNEDYFIKFSERKIFDYFKDWCSIDSSINQIFVDIGTVLQTVDESRTYEIKGSNSTQFNRIDFVYEYDKYLYYLAGYFGNNLEIYEISLQDTLTSINDDNIVENNNQYFFFQDNALINIKVNKLPALYETIYCEIFNVNSIKVKSAHFNIIDGKISIDITDLQSGIYFYYIPKLNIRGKFGILR